MGTETSSITVEVADLIRRARRAQEAIERYTQQQVDALTTAVAWSVVRQDRAEALAKLAVDEGGFGNYADKVLPAGARRLARTRTQVGSDRAGRGRILNTSGMSAVLDAPACLAYLGGRCRGRG